MSEPRHWGSWKGRVIKAIAIDNAFTWDEIRDSTGLSPKSLNQVLAELFDSKTLSKNDKGEYRVNYELYKEYRAYIETGEGSGGGDKQGGKRSSLLGKVDSWLLQKTVRISKDQQSNLIGRIDAWLDFNSLDISLKPGHFYIDGEYLDALSRDLISHTTKEVLVVNPFVDRCNVTESLMHAQSDGKKVLLVTRPPETNGNYSAKKAEYYDIIRKSGINLTYNKIVHAKLMVLDRAVAIVSSMNLYSASTAGASWEAGIVSIENTVVESVMDSIFGLLEKPESVTQ